MKLLSLLRSSLTKFKGCHTFTPTLLYSMTYDSSTFWSNRNELTIVIDSGAPRSMPPIPLDFIGKITPIDAPIQGLSATTKIKGTGTVRWVFTDSRSTSTSNAYLIPEVDIRIFSPKAYFDENKSGSFTMDPNGTVLTLPNPFSLCFEYHKGNNLRMATTMCLDMVAAISMAFDAFTSQDISNSLVKEYNQNLTQAQKKLLQWHWKLGHCSFQQIQTLLRSSNSQDSIIMTKYKASFLCPIPLCACIMKNCPLNSSNTNVF